MLKYIVRDRRVQLDPLSITLRNLQKIWMEDESTMKETAFKILTYIHLCSQVDKEAPYFTAAPSEIRALVKNDLFGSYDHSFEEREEFLDECIEDYQKAFEEAEHRAFRVIDNKIDEAQELVSTTTLRIEENTVKGEVKFASNFGIVNAIILNITKWVKVKVDLATAMEKQRVSGAVVRGGKKMTYLERELQKVRAIGGLPDGETGEPELDMENIEQL